MLYWVNHSYKKPLSNWVLAGVFGHTVNLGGISVHDKQGDKYKMATQIAPTPTLYGSDAEEVLKQIEKAPTNDQIKELKNKLKKKFEGIEKRGLR